MFIRNDIGWIILTHSPDIGRLKCFSFYIQIKSNWTARKVLSCDDLTLFEMTFLNRQPLGVAL